MVASIVLVGNRLRLSQDCVGKRASLAVLGASDVVSVVIRFFDFS